MVASEVVAGSIGQSREKDYPAVLQIGAPRFVKGMILKKVVRRPLLLQIATRVCLNVNLEWSPRGTANANQGLFIYSL